MDPPLCDLAADADGLLRAWCDGLAVVRLVELLEGRELTGVERAPRSTAQGMRNVEKALEVLRVRKGMPLTHLYHPHRLSKGEAATIVGLVADMRASYGPRAAQRIPERLRNRRV